MPEPNETPSAPTGNIPTRLPLLPVRDIVVFPSMVVPLFVGREVSVKTVEAALEGKQLLVLAAQRQLDVERPKPADIYDVGTVSQIMRTLKLPDGRIKILVQGLAKVRITDYVQTEPYLAVELEVMTEPKPPEESVELEAKKRDVKEQLEKLVSMGKVILPEVLMIIENLDDPGRLADMIISNMGAKVGAAQQILEIADPVARLERVGGLLTIEAEVLKVQHKIQSDAKGEMERTQREYYLREQLKAIQKELGEMDPKAEEVQEFRKRLKDAKMPEKVLAEAEKQLGRMEKMHQDSAEATTIRTYLEWLVELPWSKKTKDALDITAAQRVLNEDHYDLEKVKERILEYLAVRKLKAKMKGPILCFVGPPGVGKTSLGKSIARAMGRQFVRISLGGVRDEAEIRGHRRTYVGALPGRIIQGIKQAGSNNPVFMMDEVDKIGLDFRGDPAAALLEVLDPEQNHAFSDHYLGVPFDLSNVMFITTANLLDTIPSPLRDRMEVIEISGYTEEEKVGIARRHLLPRQLDEHGLKAEQVRLTDPALRLAIQQYTREAGVRNLEREIANILRKVAKKVVAGRGRRFVVTPKTLHAYLGIPKYLPELEQKNNEIGVATGLAWTETGGDIIYVEATTMKGKGNLTLTGHLGDVMKESAQAALSYIRSRDRALGLTPGVFGRSDLHIHVPAGATPKDGPSAGITMATALASILTNTPVKKAVVMTGEVTLRGRVLPVGGLKEKILAAKRHGATTVILPKQNTKDLEDVPKQVRKDLTFVFVKTMDEVLDVAFAPRRVKTAKPARDAQHTSRRTKGRRVALPGQAGRPSPRLSPPHPSPP